MLNQYAGWKYAVIIAIVAVGILFALPNVFGESPAVQISGDRGITVDEQLRERVETILESKELPATKVQFENGRVIAHFENSETQLKASDAVKAELGRGYVVALNLAPAMPDWLASIGVLPMYLGLDLRGGVHFLMEVDMPAAMRQAQDRYVGDIRSRLQREKIRYRSVTRQSGGDIIVKFRDATARSAAYDFVRESMRELTVEEVDEGADILMRVTLGEETQREIELFALQQNITTLRNRVNELGVAEPVIQQQGSNRIVVQLPGVQDTTKAKEIIGATATLQFRMVDEENSVGDALAGKVPARSKLFRSRDGTPALLQKRVILRGNSIINAASGIDHLNGQPAVFITLDGKGARTMSDATRTLIGRSMATVFTETKVERQIVDGEVKRTKRTVEEVINIATIRDQLGKDFQITGLDSTEEARDLALLLRAGALAAPIEIIEERTVGPSLGQENIDQGFRSVIIGFVLVLVFMAIYYRVFGLVANIALALNLVLIVAVLSMLQATLTLPGIAGIVLTVGMAVDANVLIFERIREEIRNGMTPQASIHAGYEKALLTIFDANITTLIAAVLLFGFGTGPIKGFAITLSIGILTSMFTAIMGTRAVINLIYGGRRVSALSI